MSNKIPSAAAAVFLVTAALGGCGDDGLTTPGSERRGAAESTRGTTRRPGGGRGDRHGRPPGAELAAVPVEVADVARRSIASFIETNGTLEAENEVDLVARVTAPVVDILVEEGIRVRQGQLLARLEEEELRAAMEISRVNLREATLALERAKTLYANQLLSPEEHEAALSRYETAQAQVEGSRIQLGYTQIRAPFSGLVVERYVRQAQQVTPNTALFRLSDFDPLLCPIQVPERELRRLHIGQPAHLEVEAWPEERFQASVLRVSPVVEAATGTVRVTLEVQGQDQLRPGMFARVFLQTEVHQDALVLPKAALSLESIGDIVYVVENGAASRREVTLGYEEGDFVEILAGVREGESAVVVGLDGLSDGTPIQILGDDSRR